MQERDSLVLSPGFVLTCDCYFPQLAVSLSPGSTHLTHLVGERSLMYYLLLWSWTRVGSKTLTSFRFLVWAVLLQRNTYCISFRLQTCRICHEQIMEELSIEQIMPNMKNMLGKCNAGYEITILLELRFLLSTEKRVKQSRTWRQKTKSNTRVAWLQKNEPQQNLATKSKAQRNLATKES